MNENIYENQYRATLVCIDGYENGILTGRMYHPCFGEGAAFKSAMEFLKQLEFMMESVNYPLSNYTIRQFCPVQKVDLSDPSLETQKTGKIATFALRLRFRQNTSWQGTVIWSEGKREENFRSVLELLFLMDSVLCEKAAVPDEV